MSGSQLPQDRGTAVFAQHLLKRTDGGINLAELALHNAAKLRRRIFCQRDAIFFRRRLGILAAPFDDAGIAHAHDDIKIHRSPIDRAANATRFGFIHVEKFALSLQFIGSPFASVGLLGEKAPEIFFANIECGMLDNAFGYRYKSR